MRRSFNYPKNILEDKILRRERWKFKWELVLSSPEILKMRLLKRKKQNKSNSHYDIKVHWFFSVYFVGTITYIFLWENGSSKMYIMCSKKCKSRRRWTTSDFNVSPSCFYFSIVNFTTFGPYLPWIP